MNTLWQDVKYALRMMRKNPGFTLVAVTALALGIGANTAIFSVVYTVVLRPLPFSDPDRLVHVFRMQPPIERAPISRPEFFEWREQGSTFREIAGYYNQTYNLTGVDAAERLSGARVTPDFFSLFGVAPAHGRFILPGDEGANGGRVAVISHGLWRRRFGGEREIVGQSVALNGEAYTIIGVAPPDFDFPRRIELWTPALLAADGRGRGSNFIQVIARLADGATVARAEAQMNGIARRLAEQYPRNHANLSVMVTPLLENQVRNVRPVLWIMLGAVLFVLLIACANVANLLLARATDRQREIAIRTALGARRWHVVRQLLTESVMLALAGGALGVVLAVWGVDLLVALAPPGVPRLAEVSFDARVLGFTLLVSLATGVVFGLVPALQVSKPDLNETLKEGTRGAATGGVRRAALRRALVVTEVALSLVLLVGAGLLVESIRRLTKVDPGFDPRNLLTANISFPRRPQPQATEETTEARTARRIQETFSFLAEVQRRIAALPGVERVGAINDLPVTGRSSVNGNFSVEGVAYNPGESPVAEFRQVTPDYFRAMGIGVRAGRAFTEHDDARSPVRIMVNETLARRFFAGESAIGKRLIVLDGEPHEIIGVVGDARQWGLDRPADPEIYFSYAQMPALSDATLVVRAGVGDPAALAESVRRAVRETNGDAPVYRVETMRRGARRLDRAEAL